MPVSAADVEKLVSEKAPHATVSLAGDIELVSSTAVDTNRLMRKLDVRILPLIILLYILAYLDRTNIGNAKVAGLETDLDLTGVQYNLCSAIFFVTYCLLEIPSNVTIKLVKPSIWIPLLMCCWGVVTTSTAFVKSFQGLVAARVILGLTEAGIFPGMAFYICSWYPRAAQARRISVFAASASITGAFGGLLAYGIVRMDGIGGLAGWSWIFLLEGLVTVAVAALAYFLMYDYPESAPFLTPAERAWLLKTIKDDTTSLSKEFKWKFIWQALRDPHAYLMVLLFLLTIMPAYTYALFLPTIINGLGFSSINAQLLSVPPSAAGCVGTLLFGWLSDRSGARGPFVLLGSLLALAGFVVLYATAHPGAGYAAVMVASIGLYASGPCILAWVGGNTGGDVKKAVVIAMVAGFGNLGGAVTSFIYRPQDSPRYRPGHAANIAFLCTAIVLCGFTMLRFARLNRAKVEQCEREGITAENASDFVDMGDASPLYRYTL